MEYVVQTCTSDVRTDVYKQYTYECHKSLVKITITKALVSPASRYSLNYKLTGVGVQTKEYAVQMCTNEVQTNATGTGSKFHLREGYYFPSRRMDPEL